MTIVLHDPRDNTYFVIDQTNRRSGGWFNCIEDALAAMESAWIKPEYFAMSIEEYRSKHHDYTIYYLDEKPQPYEFW